MWLGSAMHGEAQSESVPREVTQRVHPRRAYPFFTHSYRYSSMYIYSLKYRSDCGEEYTINRNGLISDIFFVMPSIS